MVQKQNTRTKLQPRNLLEASVTNQQKILEEFRLLNLRMDRLEVLVRSPNRIKNKIKEFYTTEEIMEMLNISRSTLLTFRQNGFIGYTQVRKSVRFTQQHIEDYIARGKNGGKGIE